MKALKRAGVPAQLHDVKGTFHGFDVFTKTEISKKMVDVRAELYTARSGNKKFCNYLAICLV